MEEEVSSHIVFHSPFDQNGSLKAIENIPSCVIQCDSQKPVNYLLKLTN